MITETVDERKFMTDTHLCVKTTSDREKEPMKIRKPTTVTETAEEAKFLQDSKLQTQKILAVKGYKTNDSHRNSRRKKVYERHTAVSKKQQ